MFRKGGGPENLHLGAVRSVRRVERPVRLSLICNRISASPGCLSRPRGAAITTAHWNATLGRTPRASAESRTMSSWGFSSLPRSPGGVSGDLSDLGWLQRVVALGRWQGIGKVLPSGLDLHGRRAADRGHRSWLAGDRRIRRREPAHRAAISWAKARGRRQRGHRKWREMRTARLPRRGISRHRSR